MIADLHHFKGAAALYGMIAVLLVSISPTWADIYRYVDKNGIVHFTNVPNSPKYQIFLRETSKVPLAEEAGEYDGYIQAASRRHGLSFALLKSVIKVESDFNPRAVSKKGALGLMQIMPANVKQLNIQNPFNPEENIMAGAQLLKRLLDRFGGQLHLALAAYNAGPKAVDRYQRIPPFKETEEYVLKVLRYISYYRKG